ncbi:MAG: hypothetical protein KDI75_07345, partial [Xanthomonadales bacterium]|nr:hypothetical protein [Xanthomonadales bacterium]
HHAPRTTQKPWRVLALSIACLSGQIAHATVQAADPADKPDTLRSVMALYGLNEEQAIARMASEAEAAETWMRIRDTNLVGYAGAWFDGERLRVATNAATDHQWIEALGALPVAVELSLQQLESRRQTASQRLATHGLISSHVDVVNNRVVFGYDKAEGSARRDILRQRLQQEGFDAREFSLEATVPALPSSGLARGGDGTRNKTLDGPYYAAPCSIGVAIDGGYVTAGHCGYAGNEIHLKSGGYTEPTDCSPPVITEAIQAGDPKIGNVQSSLYPTTDSGWVATLSGWTPVPQINGYTDGVLAVPALWSGVLPAPIGATVCRYGQASGGPFCGTVDALDQINTYYDNSGNPVSTYGLTEVLGSCTVDGDSGGPWTSPAGQVQGTTFGSGCPHLCFNEDGERLTTLAKFQPISDTLDAFGKTMLTTHGANKPSFTVLCPEALESYSGHAVCRITAWHSQGSTDWEWTASGGGASLLSPDDGLEVSISCNPGMAVHVDLDMDNPYGSESASYSFPCPNGVGP